MKYNVISVMYMAKRKAGKKSSVRRRQKSHPLAVYAGLLGTAWTVWNGYKEARRAGYHPGEALGYVVAGFSPRSETKKFDRDRVLETWAPLFAGWGVHEVVGNSRGAFGTGLGLKLNRKLPGRIKI